MLHIRQHVHQKLYTGDRLAYSNIMHAKCQQVSKVIISMIIHGDISTVTIITMIMIIIVMIRMIIIILIIALYITFQKQVTNYFIRAGEITAK